MAGEISYPWTDNSVGDGTTYSATAWQDLQKYAAGYAGRGSVNANDATLMGSGEATNPGLLVYANTPTAANVLVAVGRALVQGIFYENSAIQTLTIAANVSGNPRIDTIILRAAYASQTIRLAVLQGTPGVTPIRPALTQTVGTLWEVPLADVAVASGFTVLNPSDITNYALPANAYPDLFYDYILNNSGAELFDGDVVILDTTADRSMTTTAVANSSSVLGVVRGVIAAAAYGRVQYAGVGYINTTAAIAARGTALSTSTTVKKAFASAAGLFAYSLEITTGAGRCLCLFSLQAQQAIVALQTLQSSAFIVDQKTATTDGGSFNSGSWQTRDLNTEVYDLRSIVSVAANQFTLQPGTYEIRWSAPAYRVSTHVSKLYSITEAADIAFGSLAFSDSTASYAITTSQGEMIVTIAAATTYEIRHQCRTTAATNGYGRGAENTWAVNIYTQVWIKRLSIP